MDGIWTPDLKIRVKKLEKKIRIEGELNQGPIGSKSKLLPLSYEVKYNKAGVFNE